MTWKQKFNLNHRTLPIILILTIGIFIGYYILMDTSKFTSISVIFNGKTLDDVKANVKIDSQTNTKFYEYFISDIYKLKSLVVKDVKVIRWSEAGEEGSATISIIFWSWIPQNQVQIYADNLIDKLKQKWYIRDAYLPGRAVFP